MVDDDIIILPCDLREVRKGTSIGYCRPGLERFAAAHGLSLKHFMKNGVKYSTIKTLQDPYVGRVLDAAKRRISKEAETK